jgi:hypothetical protein
MKWVVRVSIRNDRWVQPSYEFPRTHDPEKYDWNPRHFGHMHPLRVIFDLWEPELEGVRLQTSWVEHA